MTPGVQIGGRALAAAPDIEPQRFLLHLAACLEQRRIRYCVLHSFDALPNALTSDLDIAIHPRDWHLLKAGIADLRARRYALLQWLDYAPGAAYLIFARSSAECFSCAHGSTLLTFAVDAIREHRRGGLLLARGEELVRGRRRSNAFWVASPEVEFEYLLAKKALKGALSVGQQARLGVLVRELGWKHALAAAERLWSSGAADIVRACERGSFQKAIGRAGISLRWTQWRRNPMNPVLTAVAQARRTLTRAIYPTGLFVAFFGADGAGKSTIIDALSERMPGFRRSRTFHWRPMVLFGGRRHAAPESPHAHEPHSPAVSMLKLLLWFADCWLGYVYSVRPLMMRTGLVLFDRYFDDLLIDTRRYRYGGPIWLVRLLRHCVPRPDVVLVLDAPVHVLGARKREVTESEMERQVHAYRALAHSTANARAIDATQPLHAVITSCVNTLAEKLEKRTSARYEQ